MKIVESFLSTVVLAGIFAVVGCAGPIDSTRRPENQKSVECKEMQQKALAFDGQDRNQLMRSIVALSVDVGPLSAVNLETCLTAALRVDCGLSSCVIREKYFVNNNKN